MLLKTIADQLGLMPDLVPAAVKILAVSVESRRSPADVEPDLKPDVAEGGGQS